MAVMAVVFLAVSGEAPAEDNIAAESSGKELLTVEEARALRFRAPPFAPPVHNPAYIKECGSCHLAYQPGWLPLRSWQQHLKSLDDHFGKKVVIDAAMQRRIGKLLKARAAGESRSRVSNAMMKSIPGEQTPLRITVTEFFAGKHQGVDMSRSTAGIRLESASYCLACHGEANEGFFDKLSLVKPGSGSSKAK